MMKVIARALFITCICLFLTEEVSSIGISIVGDIRIQPMNNGSIYCDSLICPSTTVLCRVTKRNDPNDLNTIIRQRTCSDKNGDVIEQQNLNEPNKNQGIVNVNVSSGGIYNSRPMTPEEKKELEEYLKKTKQQVADTIKNMQTSLRPLLDGSFASNLKNQINNSLRNPVLDFL
ncbi:uncharacterized protein LOC129918256 [Episyrphus balteatus]|uniref:uncharacterized protein LOC129918256 n=1 Tax=Episyrphus balteatus TaxID=286459 RepID=UPI002486A321|nr:uncharacterized protein LOC129918256 [Episyrphus balteatus]